jgi:Uma2 family endonuclease
MTVPVDPHTAYEPDAVVHCGPPIPSDQVIVPAPLIVVEVLSPSTAHTDTSAKLVGYFKLPSVRHYLIIDPEARTVVHHSRVSTGTIEAQTLVAGDILLDPPALQFAVADLFQS